MNERSFETLLYSVTANTAQKIMELNGWGEDEAMERFTESKLYSYLEREGTKLWQYSASMLAQLFNEEITVGLSLPEV